MGSIRRGFYLISLGLWGFLALFLLWLPVSASAAPMEYEAVRVGDGRYTTTGHATPITVKVSPAGVPKYKQLVPVANPSSLTKLAKTALRGGLPAVAISAAIDGLGYFIDQASGEFKKKTIELVPEGGSVPFASAIAYNYSPESKCRSGHEYCVPVQGPNSNGLYKWNGWNCHAGDYGIETFEHRNRCYGERPLEVERIIDLSPADWTIVENTLSSSLTPAEKSKIINKVLSSAALSGRFDTDNYPVTFGSADSYTQQVLNDWPELAQAFQAMLNAELSVFKSQLDETHLPTPEEQGLADSTIVAPPPPPPPADVTIDFELPDFCTWASFICQPFVGEAHPEVPVLDLEVQDYESGLPSTASCPAPVSVELSIFGTHELSYQPICDFAGMIRIPVIAISYLIAGFIVVGVRR